MWRIFIDILDQKDAAHSDLAHLAISLINKVRFMHSDAGPLLFRIFIEMAELQKAVALLLCL